MIIIQFSKNHKILLYLYETQFKKSPSFPVDILVACFILMQPTKLCIFSLPGYGVLSLFESDVNLNLKLLQYNSDRLMDKAPLKQVCLISEFSCKYTPGSEIESLKRRWMLKLGQNSA